MVLTTFYRKYRPQKLAELDLVEVSEGLKKIAKSGKFPHALLFAGPKGAGKTSAARIFAKVVNCQNLKDGEPCNKCPSCREITAGSALDLIEIDAASNRGIDDIRELREKIKLSPTKLKYKVYIIDEVHMLTTEAFNALLKTLEEPPAHAIFILCTTQPEKLPQTIVSRCIRFNFRKAKPQEIIEGPLKRAVKGENLKVEEGVLEEIARAVDGSFRDAHKILEQLAAEGEKITLERTKELLGQTEELGPEKLFGFLAKKDTKAALKEIDRIVQQGGDLNVYVLRILDSLRGGLLAKIGLEEENKAEVFADFDITQIRTLISLFSRAAGELKFSPIPQLPLELAVVEWGENENSKLKTQNSKLPREKQNPTSQDVNPGGQTTPQLKKIQEKWGEILAKIKPQNHSVEALLRACRPASFANEWLTLEVFYKFHKERLEEEKCRTIVEETVSEVIGAPVKLKCILGEKKNSQPNQQTKTPDILEIANDIFNGKIE